MEKVKTDKIYKKGTIVEMENKFYTVVNSRHFIPWLGEPEGFLTTLELVKTEVKADKQ